MKIVLLGTGAADGWPNAFCRCDSCHHAAITGTLRGQTSALIDDTVLVDCGPDAPGAAVRQGRSLARVRHLLITHAHVDHLGPQALLFRSWVAQRGDQRLDELEVIGPEQAIEQCRPWVGPDDPVRFTAVEAGSSITVGDYHVRVLPARHKVFIDGDAVLYDISDRTDTRILWAADTGVWPDDWFAAVADARYDAVFLEETFGYREELSEGHLGFPGFTVMTERLREVGAMNSGTETVAVHLGHHNPPEPQLRAELLACGARPGVDGQEIIVGSATSSPAAHRTLVTGGVRSGKSWHAEQLMLHHQALTYVATGGSGSDDSEWLERVEQHRRRRPASWTTVETSDVAEILRSATTPVLIDCLGTWLTARMDQHGVWEHEDVSGVEADVAEFLAAWLNVRVPVVAVSNEVGSGVVPATASGRLFRDMLGRLNSQVAAISESVVLTVAGQPIQVR